MVLETCRTNDIFRQAVNASLKRYTQQAEQDRSHHLNQGPTLKPLPYLRLHDSIDEMLDALPSAWPGKVTSARYGGVEHPRERAVKSRTLMSIGLAVSIIGIFALP